MKTWPKQLLGSLLLDITLPIQDQALILPKSQLLNAVYESCKGNLNYQENEGPF